MKLLAFLVPFLPSLAVACAGTAAQNVLRPECAITNNNIVESLASLLSPEAVVILPSSPSAEPFLNRAAGPRVSPSYLAIVEVATESDIQQTVKYANRHDIPFLTVSGAHGWTASLNKMKGGIQINMRKLNTTKLQPGGKTAIIGGGTLQHEITTALFKEKKQAVTGICGCTSVLGPLLGGGHSMIQYRYGFAADNLVSARVVLADGEIVDASAEENPDLFWALRGAGHNFGIVASAEVKVYDADETWGIITFTFTEDKLEKFFETWNKMEEVHPDAGILINGFFMMIEEVDPNKPLLLLQFFYAEGSKNALKEYETAFLGLEPLDYTTIKNIAWGDLFKVAGFDFDSTLCLKNRNILGASNNLNRWDPAAMRKTFGLLSELTSDKEFVESAVVLESYGHKAIRAIPVSENAVAPEEREYHIRVSPVLWWAGDDEARLEKAQRFASEMQNAMKSETLAFHTYINYASGQETLEEVYGHDAQRIAKLRALKKEWDPHNRFGFYMPIQ